VFLAVIGPRWMDLLRTKSSSGDRDYGREEIAGLIRSSALHSAVSRPTQSLGLCLAELVVSWRTKADLSAYAEGESLENHAATPSRRRVLPKTIAATPVSHHHRCIGCASQFPIAPRG
jgi:hypothetical protein